MNQLFKLMLLFTFFFLSLTTTSSAYNYLWSTHEVLKGEINLIDQLIILTPGIAVDGNAAPAFIKKFAVLLFDEADHDSGTQ